MKLTHGQNIWLLVGILNNGKIVKVVRKTFQQNLRPDVWMLLESQLLGSKVLPHVLEARIVLTPCPHGFEASSISMIQQAEKGKHHCNPPKLSHVMCR